GDLFQETRLKKTQRCLLRTGLFQKNDFLDGIQTKVQRIQGQNRILLRFVLQSVPTTFSPLPVINFYPGLGLILGARIQERNLLGRGQRLFASGILTTTMRLWELSFNWFEPYLADLPLSLLVSGSISSRALPNLAFSLFDVGGQIGVGLPMRDSPWTLQLHYFLSFRELSPQEEFGLVVQGFTQGRWRRAGLLFLVRFRDRVLHPKDSWSTSHSLSIAHIAPYLGASYALTRIDFSSRLLWNIASFVRLEGILRLGWIWSGNRLEPPSFERYRLGGPNMMRGFPIQSIAPTRNIATENSATFRPLRVNWGGSKNFFLDFSFYFPLGKPGLFGRLEWVLSVDIGNVFDDREAWFQDLRHPAAVLGLFWSAAAGISWKLPTGASIRMELAVPFNRRSTDPPLQFWLNAGQPF
ncbi:MAG: BamA/TamA family outer membrane protein, partial [Myxococcota bacterium]